MPGPYTDLSRPPLAARALREALVAPAGPLARLEVLEEVDSTNADLLARAGAGPGLWPHLSVVTADHQSGGRGRMGRTWSAPPRSGLAVSVLVRPGELGVSTERWTWLPLLAGLSVVTVLRGVAGLDAAGGGGGEGGGAEGGGEGAAAPEAAAVLKWPNDVLVGGRKVAGVLTEVLPPGAGAGAGAGGGVVVGIGLNVSTTAAELPVPTATSLVLLAAATTDRDVLLRSLLRTLTEEVETWAGAGGDPAASGLGDRVREVCATLGRDVAVDLPGGTRLTGTAEDLDGQGRLLVRDAAGGLHALSAGDVVHLR